MQTLNQRRILQDHVRPEERIPRERRSRARVVLDWAHDRLTRGDARFVVARRQAARLGMAALLIALMLAGPTTSVVIDRWVEAKAAQVEAERIAQREEDARRAEMQRYHALAKDAEGRPYPYAYTIGRGYGR